MNNKAIIGLSCLSHDAAIAAVVDDQIVFASQAERYSRIKNDKFLNSSMIDDMAKYIGDDYNAIFYERPLLKKARQLYSGQYKSIISSVSPQKYIKQFPVFDSVSLKYVSHHLSHACAGYFTSTFRDAAIVIVDSIGEWETLTIWHAKDRKLKKVNSVKYPSSLGLFYSSFTQRVGFKPNEEEYIMMGMSAFGQPIYADIIKQDFFANSQMPYFKLKHNMHRGIRQWRPNIHDVENIAASCQKVLEDALLEIFYWVAKNVPSKNLVYGGGVALNCVFNQKLAKSGLFDNIWILPEPGDAGNSIGAALAYKKDWIEWKGPYLGYDINRELDIDSALSALLNGEIIGIANGRAEFGPRALGNRSLLADPRGDHIKNKVNNIKKRELFRPFAPIILEEHATKYFDLPYFTSPYMQFVADCKKPTEIPAVCHVDGTSRVQTLREDQNPIFYKLLKKFYNATGCPILLNTSLNIKGEPLVNTWDDAQRFGALHNISIF
ncbi:MAG: carbamoyltransferase [Neisseriaceae bacterium]|jgi:carbamoyltransferase